MKIEIMAKIAAYGVAGVKSNLAKAESVSGENGEKAWRR
jgi:hypothetical protein